ncbi:hypothetical protein ASE55_07335 [Chryseobacterium sp. Leaf201]|nr:hypothetical protein ASE55_07335 [Chryseobacterium sp. Leaf201]
MQNEPKDQDLDSSAKNKSCSLKILNLCEIIFALMQNEPKDQDLDSSAKNKSCSLKILNLCEIIFGEHTLFSSHFGQKNFLNVHRLYFLNASDSYVVFYW